MSTNQKKEKVKFELNTIEFDAHASTKFLTSNELEKMFNKIFRGIFCDYEGCYLTPVVGDVSKNEVRVDLTLYFTDKTNHGEKIKTLIATDKTVKEGASPIERMISLNNRVKSNIYEIDPESKDIFEDLSYNQKWVDKMAIQQVDPANRNLMLVKVIGIDPVKIIEKMYGTKVNGEEFTYRISPVKIMAPNNFMLRIERLNKVNATDFFRKMGFAPQVMSGIPINRE